eukprot:TRINITY_DN4774_c1_g1_i4.p1 TRINITY_DN4774_c1_g1~~TRINITY_DN4774_c1_g1_i4.p1  ORF type:complete len:409 (+),score=42.21 TRINITY_DN4774_c1_g1_i4:97-1227(+)
MEAEGELELVTGNTVVFPPREKHTATVILLHGYGDNAREMTTCASRWRRQDPGLRVVCPNGIRIGTDQRTKMCQRVWATMSTEGWDHHKAWANPEPGTGHEVTIPELVELVAKEQTDGVPVGIAGFSQGGQVAVAVALKHAQRHDPVMGVVAMAPAPLVPAWTVRTKTQIPVAVVWGTREPWDSRSVQLGVQVLRGVGIEPATAPIDEAEHELTRGLIDAAWGQLGPMLRGEVQPTEVAPSGARSAKRRRTARSGPAAASAAGSGAAAASAAGQPGRSPRAAEAARPASSARAAGPRCATGPRARAAARRAGPRAGARPAARPPRPRAPACGTACAGRMSGWSCAATGGGSRWRSRTRMSSWARSTSGRARWTGTA